MVFWILAIAITIIALAALYYAALGRGVNAEGATAQNIGAAALAAHNRAQLAGIDADLASGQLSDVEGIAAKAELARELIQQRQDAKVAAKAGVLPKVAMPVALAAIAILGFGAYWQIGSPGLPTAPLASRIQPVDAVADIEDAMARVERQLIDTPDDVRGWRVIAPVYMQLARFEDAEHAYRRILELELPSADAESDLAEALMMRNQGHINDEALELLQSAAARDPNHVRSRFYLAGLATENGEFETAIVRWTDLIALAQGDEDWLESAKSGLLYAQTGGVDSNAQPLQAAPEIVLGEDDQEMVLGMVSGLAERLRSDGGTLEEWTRLVRSYLVLGDAKAAQEIYVLAATAYPDPLKRTELDELAKQAGLSTVAGD